MVDPESLKVTGIIDFEDLGIGDRAYDLIFINQGKSFFNNLLDNYSYNDSSIRQRILFYHQRVALPYFLYGIEHNNQEMIEYGKYLLEKRKNYYVSEI